MLKEVIKFVETLPEEHTIVENWQEKKFVVIKTKEKNNQLVYGGHIILDDTSAIKEWINKNEHYKEIIEHLTNYVLPDKLNKALGSSSGLATYSFFVFKLSEKNLDNLDKKINKTKFTDKSDNQQLPIENIHKILKDAKPDLMEKTNDDFRFLDYHVLIHTDKKRFEDWKKITDKSIREKMTTGKKNTQTEGQCFVCKKIGEVSSPAFLFNNNVHKIFLRHVTRNSVDGKGMAMLACAECVLKSNKFNEFLKNYKIKIFPLFIDDTLDTIQWLDDDLKESNNKFNFIFNQLEGRNKNVFDFYLVVKSNDYFSFDYITGYKWNIGYYTDFFNDTKKSVTRHDIEIKISRVISNKSYIEYFDKLKGNDNQQTNIIYSLRQKLFDFVYRNQTTFTSNDLVKIILFRVENEIRNNTSNSESYKETLNLFFNRGLLLQTSMNENILEQVKLSKKMIASGKFEEFKIQDDEEWAYFAGQLAYYLVSLSQSKAPKFGLLEPFTNKSTTKLVKSTINEIYDRYKHEISLNNKRFKTIATQILAHKIDRSFIDLKIPFYIGAFDDNVICSKKEGSDDE